MKTIIVLIGISLLYTCGKPEVLNESSPGVKVIDKTITNAMYFKPGSYWIYESDRGEIDSMWVDSRSRIGFDRNFKTQTFTSMFFSSIPNNSIIVGVEFWNKDQPDTQIRISIGSWHGNTSGGGGNVSGRINADIFRPAKSTNNSCVTCTGDTAILMPTYKVKGKEYKNVWRFLSKNMIKDYPSSLITDTVGYYFFAENYGIIQKFENVSGAPNHFKLKRYHIEK